jgi:hypothetical protein
MFDVIIVTQGIIYGRREMEIEDEDETDEEDEDEEEEEYVEESVTGTEEGGTAARSASSAASGLDANRHLTMTTTATTRREDG